MRSQYSAVHYCTMEQKALQIIGALTIVLKIVLCSQAVDAHNTESDVTFGNDNCPLQYFLDGEGKCSFSHKLPKFITKYGNTSELDMGLCMTVTNSSLVVSQCPYLPVNIHNLSQYHSIYQVLPNQFDQMNNSLCAPFNRKGFLCSECKENYGLAAYRYYGLVCVKCSSSAGQLHSPTFYSSHYLLFCVSDPKHQCSLWKAHWLHILLTHNHSHLFLLSFSDHTPSKPLWILAYADSAVALWSLESRFLEVYDPSFLC